MNDASDRIEGIDFSESTILIIDDNPDNLNVAVDSIAKLGATVIVSRSGKGGLKRAVYAQPDLILLDILMPGMDGFEVCHQLKDGESTRSIPVIFMTALSDSVDKVRGLRAGGIDYITKPFQIEELLARIGNHLDVQKVIRSLKQRNRELQVNLQEPVIHSTSTDRNLKTITDYIQANLCKAISLDELSTELGMNQFYFCRWFKQSMGIAPYQYVIRQRVKQAKTLLLQGDLSYVDIALQCGFNSQSHFIHHFKKHEGLTPRKFQQMQ